MIYIYPEFPAVRNYDFLRIGGSGLANCLFVYARAVALASRYNAKIIKPCWFNLSIGPYIRRQKDKRHYLGLFSDEGEVSAFKKAYLLSRYRHVSESDFNGNCDNVVVEVSGIENYFRPILPYHKTISDYICAHVLDENLVKVNSFDFSGCVAVHVRLGDYVPEWRVPISWYRKQIEEIQLECPETRFLLFSDGSDSELIELTAMQNVQRAFFGNAIADIIAISRCSYLIGSDSTFSAWGAYLGQIPCHFYKLKSAPVLADSSYEIVDIPAAKQRLK